MNLPKAVVVAAAALCITVAAAEIVARAVFGLQPLMFGYPYHPIFVSGDYYYLNTNEQLANGPGGPTAYGYEEGLFGYHYDPKTKAPHTSSNFTDFLFNHTRSRYNNAEVDGIECADKGAAAVFVLGGSVAQGFSASTPQTTWHGVLEELLRRKTNRQDVYLFNAAMGAFFSLQEKLAYYLAVVPRKGDAVLLLNSYNDLVIPANGGTRPGDPFQLATRFSQFFGNGFVWWLAKHGAIVNGLIEAEFVRHALAYRTELEQDDGIFAQYAETVTDIYMENMGEVLDDCDARHKSCLVAIQPNRALTAANIGARFDDIISEKRMKQLYDLLFAKIEKSAHRAHFIDLTHIFDSPEKIKYYADTVHPNDPGQRLLAEALLDPILTLVTSGAARTVATSRCVSARPG
jgi:lysophospholipase L1-like esterase